jgi:DNA (cytosine-5)-methyltransferase 1
VLTLASTFAGIGGFDLAAEQEGVKPMVTVEIDRAAQAVLRYHWPDITHLSDIKDVSANDLLAAGFDPADGILSGGWPCQSISRAGGRAGMAQGSGTRSALFWELHRLVRDLRPAWLVAENVPGALTSHHGRDWGAAIGELAELGYGVAWRVLDSQNFGVPQRRRRVFVVARRTGVGGVAAAARQATEVLADRESGQRDPRASATQGRALAAPPGRGHAGPGSGRPETRATTGNTGTAGGSVLTFQKVRRAQNPADDERWEERGVAATLNTFDNGSVRAVDVVVQPGMPVRRLTPLEHERLHGFPDGHTMYRRSVEGIVTPQPDSARYRQLGNAVSVPVAQWIVGRITTES